MSRSGYSEDCENLGLWRAAVTRAVEGKRGQAFLSEMAAALDAMPVRELIAGEVVRDTEHVCALGSVAVARKLDLSEGGFDIYDGREVGKAFGIARSLACEIAYENDEQGKRDETPAQRWKRMRSWVSDQLRASPVRSDEGKGDGT